MNLWQPNVSKSTSEVFDSILILNYDGERVHVDSLGRQIFEPFSANVRWKRQRAHDLLNRPQVVAWEQLQKNLHNIGLLIGCH